MIKSTYINSSISKLDFIFLNTLIFFYILAPRLKFGNGINTGYVSIILFTLVILFQCKVKLLLPIKFILILCFYIFTGVYFYILSSLNDNNANDFLFICLGIVVGLLYGYLFALYLSGRNINKIDSIDIIIKMISCSALINSIIVIFEYLFYDLKNSIESILVQNTEGLIYLEHPFQLRGFAAAGGAGLSVFNAIAIILIIYLNIHNKLKFSHALIGISILTVANIFIGRTGFISACLIFLLYMIYCISRFMRDGNKGFLNIIIFTIFGFLAYEFYAESDKETAVMKWAFEFFNNASNGSFSTASSDDLKTMLFIPDEPIDLLFGIGFFDGVPKIYARTDSGYIKTLLSIGIFLAIFFYYILIKLIINLIKISKRYKYMVISMVLILMLFEIKEPFMYQNFTARLLFLLSGAAIHLRSLPKQGMIARL